MKKYETKKETVAICTLIRCNKCTKIVYEDCKNISEDYLAVHKLWGYFSKNDGKRYNFDLCEACFLKFIKRFKIKPYIDTVEAGRELYDE